MNLTALGINNPVVSCLSEEAIREEVMTFCTGTIPAWILGMAIAGLLFLSFVFFSIVSLYKQLNKMKVVNLSAGWEQLQMALLTKDRQAIKNNTELNNFWNFVVLLFYLNICVACNVIIVILLIRNYFGG